MKTIIALLAALLLPLSTAHAEFRSVEQFDNHHIFYSAFNSDFLNPDIASLYGLNRGIDKGLVNIALVPKGSAQGHTARVTGTVSDLLQRQQVLEFTEIREGDAVYYLAPFTFDHEDPLTFKLHVDSASGISHRFSFQRTLYQSR